MKIFDFTVPGWWVVTIAGIFILGICWLVASSIDDPDIKKALETPIKDMTIGHLTLLIMLAGIFFN